MNTDHFCAHNVTPSDLNIDRFSIVSSAMCAEIVILSGINRLLMAMTHTYLNDESEVSVWEGLTDYQGLMTITLG